ncbi:MAG: flavodoxin, partial [Eubacteriales bacterium]
FTTRNSTKRKADADSLSSASEVTVGDKTYGNAELLAKYAADAAGADVFSIETAKAYDEDYNDALEEAQEEQNRDARPELKETVSNMEDYDTIVLIYPMWWGDMPMAVRTFLESYDFSGKTIYPISTHGGSGMGCSVETIKRLAKGATVKDGLAVSGNSVTDAEADVRSYLG